MKYFLIIMLFTQPAFAILNSKDARNVADNVNEQRTKNQLPKLLDEIDTAINLASEEGQYETSIYVDKYDPFVVSKAEDFLSKEGYGVMSSKGFGKIILSISW